MDNILEEVKKFQALVKTEGEGLFEKAIVSCTASVIVDEEGTIIYSTAEACRMFGYIDKELEGMKLELLMPERFRNVHASQHRPKFFNSRQDRPMGENTMKLIGLHSDKSEFNIQISLCHKIFAGKRVAIAVILKTHINK